MVAKVTAFFPAQSLPKYGTRRLCLWYSRFSGNPVPLCPPPDFHLAEAYDFDSIEDAIAFRRVSLKVFSDGTNLGDGLRFQIVIEGKTVDIPRTVNGIMASRIAYE